MEADSSTTVGVRRATLADLSDLCALARETEIRRWLSAPGVFTYIAERQEPFGMVTVGPHDLDETRGEVLAWRVTDASTGQGYGRKLLVHGLSVLKRRGFEDAVVWLPASASRPAQIAARLGFAPLEAEKMNNTERGTTHFRLYGMELLELF